MVKNQVVQRAFLRRMQHNASATQLELQTIAKARTTSIRKTESMIVSCVRYTDKRIYTCSVLGKVQNLRVGNGSYLKIFSYFKL